WELPVRIDVTAVRRWKPKPTPPATPAPEPQPTPALTTEKPLRRLEGATKGSIQSMIFVPRAGTLLSASWDDITFWNWSKGQLVSKVATKDHRVTCFALSPDGAKGLSGSFNKSLRLWDMKTARPLRDLPGHTAPVWCVEFSPDGKKALSGGGTPKPGGDEAAKYVDCAIRVWDIGRVQELCRFNGHSSEVKHVTFLPDGRHVLSAGLGATHSFCIWDTTTGKEVRRLAERLKQAVFAATSSIDGRYLLFG